MRSEILTRLRRSLSGMKVGVAAVTVFGILYCVVPLATNARFAVGRNYAGFMITCGVGGILPTCLMVLCAGSAQYGAFALVRRDPREQLKTNMTWLVVVGVAGALSALLIFVLMEFVVFTHRVTPGVASLDLMLLVQTFMMVQSIGLICLLLVNFGLSWGQFLPVVIGFFILTTWLLNPLAGNATKYIYYFWYPISPVWRTVVAGQIIPFVGYCLLMVMANVAAFERTDRLGR